MKCYFVTSCGNNYITALFKRKSHVEIAHKSEEKELGNGICKEEVQFVCHVASWVDGIAVKKLKFTWSIGGVILFEEEKQGSGESSTLTMDKTYRNGNTKANFEVKTFIQTIFLVKPDQ